MGVLNLAEEWFDSSSNIYWVTWLLNDLHYFKWILY